jgi:hypothetical protein
MYKILNFYVLKEFLFKNNFWISCILLYLKISLKLKISYRFPNFLLLCINTSVEVAQWQGSKSHHWE